MFDIPGVHSGLQSISSANVKAISSYDEMKSIGLVIILDEKVLQ
jgi:hypothetical protein